MQFETHKNISLSLMGVVCDRDKREKVTEVLENQKAFFNLVTLGKGTANSKMLGYLGLGETEKIVFFSIMPSHVARQCIQVLDEKMQLYKPGHGIAYMCPVSEGCYHRPVAFTGTEDGGSAVEQDAGYNMIMVVLNRGYTEEVMEEARGAGAAGGTVLHARGCGLAGAEKFFGITIQPEKEMIMILAKEGVGCGIMAAIADNVGPGTDAGAVSFSMPVTAVQGISEKGMPGQ